MNSVDLCSIYRVLGCCQGVRSSDITSPTYHVPTLLIVDGSHRQKVSSVLMAGKISASLTAASS